MNGWMNEWMNSIELDILHFQAPEHGKPLVLGLRVASKQGLEGPEWGFWPCLLSFNPGHTGAWVYYKFHEVLGKNSESLRRAVPGTGILPQNSVTVIRVTIHCPILCCLWVFHSREADTHHGFLWPSSSLLLLALCWLWLNFLLLLLGELQVKYPNVGWAGRDQKACNPLAVVRPLTVLSDSFPFLGPLCPLPSGTQLSEPRYQKARP